MSNLLTPPVTFTTPGCNRASAVREDPDQLKAMFLATNGLFLSCRGNRILCQLTSTGPTPAWMDASHLPQNRQALFLGTRESTPLFVLQDPTEPAAQQKYIHIRSVASAFSAADASVIAHAQSLLQWHNSFRFCPQCAAKLSSFQGGSAKRCTACSKDYYPRINPVVIVLITYQNKLLLARQPRFPKNMYSCIAGFVETGESLETAVRRETQEELGLQVQNIRYLGDQPWPFPSQLMLGFHAEACSPELTIDGNELEQAHWFERQEVVLACQGKHPKGYFVPPSVAIARHMIEHYLGPA